jgi:hypothetical protein
MISFSMPGTETKFSGLPGCNLVTVSVAIGIAYDDNIKRSRKQKRV